MKITTIEQVKDLIKNSPEHLIAFLGNNLIFDDGEDIHSVLVDDSFRKQVIKSEMFEITKSNMHTIVKLKN